MKKLFCFLTVLVLLLSAGCAKENGALAEIDEILQEPVDSAVTDEKETVEIPDAEETNKEATAGEDATEDATEDPKTESAEEQPAVEESNELEKQSADNETNKSEKPSVDNESTKIVTIEEYLATVHPELNEYLKDKEYIIIQAKKAGESVKVEDENRLKIEYAGSIRTPLEVTKVYRGPYKEGDRISYWDFNGTFLFGGDLCVTYNMDDLPPIEDGIEYLMLLRKDQCSAGSFYRSLSGPWPSNHLKIHAKYTFISIAEREKIAEKVKKGTATKYDEFHHALLEGLVE